MPNASLLMPRRLGRSGLVVSALGLGTMNFGSQLAEREAFSVADAALEMGINFFDTAEMYASPPSPESYGRSELILGRWMAGKPRDRMIVATKIVGPADGLYTSGAHIRSGQATLDRFHIARAIEDSLRRLRTDHVDLLQFHWPDRVVPWEEQLEAIDRAIGQGRVRYFGCSNETAWGLMRAVATSDRDRLPRPISVQNVLNLVEPEEYERLREICVEEGIGYIAYSPLAMGLLTGKYTRTEPAEDSRFARWSRYRERYLKPSNQAAVETLTELARRQQVSLPELAFWWALTRPAVGVVLTGASSPAQLEVARRGAELASAGEPSMVD